MEYCSSTLERLPAPAEDSNVIIPSFLPQLNIFMCRIQWILSPHPSDEGSYVPERGNQGWMGAAKVFFWLAAAIGAGILISFLSG